MCGWAAVARRRAVAPYIREFLGPIHDKHVTQSKARRVVRHQKCNRGADRNVSERYTTPGVWDIAPKGRDVGAGGSGSHTAEVKSSWGIRYSNSHHLPDVVPLSSKRPMTAVILILPGRVPVNRHIRRHLTEGDSTEKHDPECLARYVLNRSS